jgi:hypothetical protein
MHKLFILIAMVMCIGCAGKGPSSNLGEIYRFERLTDQHGSPYYNIYTTDKQTIVVDQPLGTI